MNRIESRQHDGIAIFLRSLTVAWILPGLILTAGCGHQIQDVISVATKQASRYDMPKVPVPVDDSNEMGVTPNPETPVRTSSMPSPDRTNPFEMSGEYQVDSAVEFNERKRDIRVLGFIELDETKAMISIDGKVSMFRSGDTFDKVTVVEMKPPMVRVSYDGVIWNSSLFDSHSQAKQ